MKLKLTLTILCLILTVTSSQVHALDLIARSTISVDESITREDNIYSNPSEILVVPISVDRDFSLTDTEWYRGIYYYTVDRLGFADMPYHYLVSESGSVFKGNKFGEEKLITLTDFNSQSVIIGYVHKGSTTNIDPRAEKPLKDLILQIGNYNNINPSKTSIRSLKFKRNKDAKTIETIAEKVFGSWESSVTRLVNQISGFAPVSKEYSAEVLEVIAPTDEVDPGQEITVSLRLKNSGVNGNYSLSNSELILSKIGSGTSVFFINNVWLTQTQTPIMADGQNLLPGQEQKFDLKVKAPLYVGAVTESFELRTFAGSKIQLTGGIDIRLNVRRTDRRIVEIKNNAAGASNVYNQPYTSSGVALRAASGERFFLLEENLQTLWAKLDLGNGQSGYIAVWNLTYL